MVISNSEENAKQSAFMDDWTDEEWYNFYRAYCGPVRYEEKQIEWSKNRKEMLEMEADKK